MGVPVPRQSQMSKDLDEGFPRLRTYDQSTVREPALSTTFFSLIVRRPTTNSHSTKVLWDWRVIANARDGSGPLSRRPIGSDPTALQGTPPARLPERDIANAAPAERIRRSYPPRTSKARRHERDEGYSSLLKVHAYFHGASDETLEEVARGSGGSRILRPAASCTRRTSCSRRWASVLRGRLKAVRVSPSGIESLFRMIEPRRTVRDDGRGALNEPVPIRGRGAGAHDDPPAGPHMRKRRWS